MYLVTIDNGAGEIPVHSQQYKLHSGTVVQGINTIDSFTFTALPRNPAFGALNDFTTIVRVYNTTKRRYEFEGRVLCSTVEMNESGLLTQEATCESNLGYLCDSVQEYVAEQTWSAKDLLSRILSVHNSQVEAYKKINRGAWEVPDGTWTGAIERGNSLDALKKVLDIFGGEIQVRRDTLLYLDYKPKLGGEQATAIALSKNMKTITRERDPSSFITRLIPLGAKLKDTDGNDTEDRVSILPEYNDGKNYIDDEAALAVYGIHMGYAEFDDATDVPTLRSKARAWLENNNKVAVKYAITALDLSLIGLAIDDFEVHNYYPIKHKLLGVDDVARVIKKTIDITDETKTSIEIGESFKTLSEIQREQYNSLGTEVAGLLKTVQTTEARILQAISDTYVTDDELQASISSLEITKDKITALVGETYATKDELDGYVTTDAMESRIEATVSGLNLSAYAKTTEVDSKLSGYATTQAVDNAISDLADSIDAELKGYATTTEMNSQLALKADSATLSTYGETLDAYGNRLDSAEAKIATAVTKNDDGTLTSAITVSADTFTLESDALKISGGHIISADTEAKSYTYIHGGVVRNMDAQAYATDDPGTYQYTEMATGRLYFHRYKVFPEYNGYEEIRSGEIGWWIDEETLELAGTPSSYQVPLRLTSPRLAIGSSKIYGGGHDTIGALYGSSWHVLATEQFTLRSCAYCSLMPDTMYISADQTGVYAVEDLNLGAEGNIYIDAPVVCIGDINMIEWFEEVKNRLSELETYCGI